VKGEGEEGGSVPQAITYRLKACGVLYDEHRTVQSRLAKVEPLLRPSSSPEVFAQGLGALLAVLEKELPPHFAKEEEALFPVMESVMGRGFPPIEVMKAEHAFLIEHFQAVRDSSAKLLALAGARDPRLEALKHLTPLLQTLEDHILKEDSVLLVMAADQLEPSHDSKILRVFDEIDREGRRWG
jgi:iron-sulfur cluster repair protein YtfE (RIC family)